MTDRLAREFDWSTDGGASDLSIDGRTGAGVSLVGRWAGAADPLVDGRAGAAVLVVFAFLKWSAAKSVQFGFVERTRASFLGRPQRFSSFSRAIAALTFAKSSK